MGKGTKGQVMQVTGPVVDVEFPPEELPEIYNALNIERDGGRLVLEVEQQLGDNWVRTVAMDTTDGLRRGTPVVDTGAPIEVPVGTVTLGRIFNVTGDLLLKNRSPRPSSSRRA
jgi:F-type H+-transporting ATPase subunit beta